MGASLFIRERGRVRVCSRHKFEPLTFILSPDRRGRGEKAYEASVVTQAYVITEWR
jgi:hypothetical protein